MGVKERVLERTGLRRPELARDLHLLGVLIRSRRVHDPVPIAQRDVAHAGDAQQMGGRDAGRAGAGDDHAKLGELLAHDRRGVTERGEHHDRGAVLIVMEDRDVKTLAQLALDDETRRRGDVLEVDAAEHRRDMLHGAHDLVGVLRVETERERGDARELGEDERFSLHHGKRAPRTDVPEPEHGGAVAHHGDGVLTDGQLPRLLLVLRERAADPRDPGRVHEREVVARAHRHASLRLDLPAEVEEERAIGHRAHRDPVELLEILVESLSRLLVGAVDGDVAHVDGGRRLHQIDRAEAAAPRTDRRRDAREHARPVGDLQTEDEAVRRTQDSVLRLHCGQYPRRLGPLSELSNASVAAPDPAALARDDADRAVGLEDRGAHIPEIGDSVLTRGHLDLLDRHILTFEVLRDGLAILQQKGRLGDDEAAEER